MDPDKPSPCNVARFLYYIRQVEFFALAGNLRRVDSGTFWLVWSFEGKKAVEAVKPTVPAGCPGLRHSWGGTSF